MIRLAESIGTIGIDLDNTLALYDELFAGLAVERQLVPEAATWTKRQVRDAVRATAGDDTWQYLQAEAYGHQMHRARVAPGAKEFLHACRDRGISVKIVSHKTAHSHIDPRGPNLRDTAAAWLQKELFDDPELHMSLDDVAFEDDRQAKVARIRQLGCQAFVDDLEEVFLTPDFPSDCHKLLFDPSCGRIPDGFALAGDWHQISRWFFGD